MSSGLTLLPYSDWSKQLRDGFGGASEDAVLYEHPQGNLMAIVQPDEDDTGLWVIEIYGEESDEPLMLLAQSQEDAETLLGLVLWQKVEL